MKILYNLDYLHGTLAMKISETNNVEHYGDHVLRPGSHVVISVSVRTHLNSHKCIAFQGRKTVLSSENKIKNSESTHPKALYD